MPTSEIIYGFHALTQRLEHSYDQIETIYLSDTRHDKRATTIIALAKQHHIRIEKLALSALDKLTNHAQHQGVAALVQPTKTYQESDITSLISNAKSPPLLLVLDGVQDPHNVGACLRAADGAGVCMVIVPKDNACGLTPLVRKIAAGAAESLPFIQVTNLARTLQLLQKQGIWLVGLDEKGSGTIYDMELSGPIAIVMGAEGTGLRRLTKKHCDFLANIPMQGAVPSLNVSVATGICLFEAVRQQKS